MCEREREREVKENGGPVNSTSLIHMLSCQCARCQQVYMYKVLRLVVCKNLKSTDACAQISSVTRAPSKPENSLNFLMVAS